MKSNLFLFINSLVLTFSFLLSSKSLANASLVKVDSISVAGASNFEASSSVIYGGIAGTCSSPDGASTCNTCKTATTLDACNLTSIYAALPLSISFKITKDVSNAKAIIAPMNSSGTISGSSTEISAQNYTTTSTIGPLTLTWSELCGAAGLTSCSGATNVYTAKVGFGVDTDGDGDVDTDEMSTLTVKIQYIAPSDTASSANECTSASGAYGLCSLQILAGDQKFYIKDQGYIYSSSDSVGTSGSIEWESVALFSVPVSSVSAGAAAITGFSPSQQESPIFKAIDKEGNISDFEIKGGFENYQTYCLIYGTRNKAQNIYRFVAGTAASASAATMADKICKAPSEVIGVLEDKHCFISTAAFGSDMASEVQIFRDFRNRFLLSHQLGRLFVKSYYEFSPPIADIISKSETLRSITRGLLYPFLVFSEMALKYGFNVALLSLLVLLILIRFGLSQFRSKSFSMKKMMIFFLVILTTQFLKAQERPEEIQVPHPDAAKEGLVRITKDGTYIYDIKRDLKKESGRLVFGYALQPVISIEVEKRDAQGNGTNQFQTFKFEDFYDSSSGAIIGYDYEWFPFVGKTGKLGLQVGGSLMFAQGNGILLSTFEKSQEKFTFMTLPLTLGAVYRLESKDKQLFAPYVSGGGTYTVLMEKREDKATPHFTAAPGFYAAGGLLTNLGVIDPDSGYALDSEYGVSNLWITLEYRTVQVNSDAFDFTNNYISAGLSFDF